MKHWFNKNYKALIITAFLIPIITVAVVSISHVTQWYGLSNPLTWAIYLSVGIEIAALSALAAISANMGSKVYFPFAIVTLIQFIGNIFFSYTYIDLDSQQFKDWVTLVSPVLEFIGIEENNLVSHKRFLSLFSGGMLPLISLTFLHMLVKFTKEDKLKEEKTEKDNEDKLNDQDIINEHVEKINASDIVSEVSRIRLSDDDLKLIESVLMSPPKPNEKLKEAYKNYKEKIETQELKTTPYVENVFEEKQDEIEDNEDDGSSNDIVDNNPVVDTLDNDVVDIIETVTIDDEELNNNIQEIEDKVSEIDNDTEKKKF
jgi:hypothetical protein